MNALGGLCVTAAGTESFDDLDIADNVLPRVEFLREPFRNKLKDGILLRFVDDNEAGWHADVSYKKGMIGCEFRKSGGLFKIVKVREWLETYLLNARRQSAFERDGADSLGSCLFVLMANKSLHSVDASYTHFYNLCPLVIPPTMPLSGVQSPLTSA